MWAPHPRPGQPQQPSLSQRVQQLVREARCYPPEREPRIVRDVSDCCRNFPGLQPKLQPFVYESHGSAPKSLRLLALDGVIPITYRGHTYNTPICIWCMSHYPNEPPVPYVRPTANMVIRKRHSHVDSEGRVYLPHYISIWDPTQYTFYGVVVAMIRVFSVEPPLHSVAASPNSANDPQRRQLIMGLTKHLIERLNDVNEEATNEIAGLLAKKDELIKSDKEAGEEMRQKATEHKAAEDKLKSLNEEKHSLEEWVKGVGNTKEELQIDEMLRYKNILDEQLVDCKANDLAYTEALDQVDEAFVQGVISQERYMKDLRNVSRDQFYTRALRRKIEKTVSRDGQNGSSSGHTAPRQLMSTRTMRHMYSS